MTGKHTPAPWRWVNSTCTHGGYGKCREGCKREGLWGSNPEFENEVWLGQCLLKADIALVVAAPEMYASLNTFIALIERGFGDQIGGGINPKQLAKDATELIARIDGAAK